MDSQAKTESKLVFQDPAALADEVVTADSSPSNKEEFSYDQLRLMNTLEKKPYYNSILN